MGSGGYGRLSVHFGEFREGLWQINHSQSAISIVDEIKNLFRE
jgi:hypothetical protein